MGGEMGGELEEKQEEKSGGGCSEIGKVASNKERCEGKPFYFL